MCTAILTTLYKRNAKVLIYYKQQSKSLTDINQKIKWNIYSLKNIYLKKMLNLPQYLKNWSEILNPK